jgi:diguanylate cyclase (GGDEF)-like protein
MSLDIPTLFIVSTCIASLLGLFLFFAWVQDRAIRALAWWGAAYLLGGLGVALWIVDAGAPTPSYGLSSALLFGACGTIWNGARLFYGRSVHPFALSAGAILWMIACQVPAFAESGVARVVLSSLIVSFYTFCTARELWRDRRKRTRSRWAAVCVPILHGLVFLPPIPLAVMRADEATLLSNGWMAVFTLETLLYVVGTAFIALMMAKERMETIHKTAAITDPLTGLLNRRGFLEVAERMIGHARNGDRLSVLMFDLDHFKAINDNHGHAIGDDALRIFAQTIQGTMREGDVFGRLGGEEFAALVAAGSNDAAIAAERVRAAFEIAGIEISGRRLGATVSVGVADAPAADCNVGQLLSRADVALYAAKHEGRNRVICAPEEKQAPAGARKAAGPLTTVLPVPYPA